MLFDSVRMVRLWLLLVTVSLSSSSSPFFGLLPSLALALCGSTVDDGEERADD
jgi:hypothetical protein